MLSFIRRSEKQKFLTYGSGVIEETKTEDNNLVINRKTQKEEIRIAEKYAK